MAVIEIVMRPMLKTKGGRYVIWLVRPARYGTTGWEGIEKLEDVRYWPDGLPSRSIAWPRVCRPTR